MAEAQPGGNAGLWARIDEDCEGPLEIAGRVNITSTVTGQVVVTAGAELRLSGQVNGEVIVKAGGDLLMLGTVKGAVINEGGAVGIFGFVGRVEDQGDKATWVSRGAIIGGKRAERPMKLSRFLQLQKSREQT